MTEFTEKVIFDGAKTLWKSRINLEVLIVHHVSSHESVVEVITYNSNIGAESTRIYADYSLIANRIPSDVIDLHKSEKHDFFLKHHIVMGATELTATVIQEIIIEFITSRLSLRTDLAEGQFEIYLEPHFGDALQHSTGKLEVECDPPKHLHPYEVKRRPHTSYVAFKEEISKFSDDKKSIDKECNIALTYEHEAEHNLEIERKLRHKHYKNEHKLHVNRWKLAIKRVIDLQRNHYFEVKYCPTQHKHAAKISKWLGSKLGETIRHKDNSINKNNRTAVSQYAKKLDTANTTHLRPLDTEHHSRRNSHGDKLERVHGSVGVLNPDPKHVNAMRSWSQDHGVVSAPLTSHSTPALHNSAEYKPKDFREWRDDDTQISEHGPVNTSSHSTSKSHHSYLTKPVAKHLPSAHTSLFDVTTTVLTDDHHLLPSTKLHSTAQHPAVHRQDKNSSHNNNHSTHSSGSNKAKERDAVPHHVPAINTTSNSNSNNNNATIGSTSAHTSSNTKEQPHSTVYDVLHTAHAEQQTHNNSNNSNNSGTANNRSPVRTPSPSLVNNFVSLSTNNTAHVPIGVHLKPIEDNIGHGTTLDAHGAVTGRHSPHHEPIILQKLQHRPKELSSNNLLELGNISNTKHASPSHSAHHGADDRHPHPHVSHSSHISAARDHSPDLNRTRRPSVHFDEPLLGESIPLTLDLHAATNTTAHSTSTVRRKSNENMQHSGTVGSLHLSPVKQHSGELGGSGDLRSALKKKTSENLGIAEAGIISSTSLDRRHSKDLRLETHHSPSTLPPLSPMTTAHHGPNSSNSNSPHTSLLRRLSPGKELNFDAYKTVPVGDPQDHRHALKCVDADDVLEDV